MRVRAAPRRARDDGPVRVSTRIERGNAFTPWSKWSRTCAGEAARRSPYDGTPEVRLACANAAPGSDERREHRARRARSHRCGAPASGERWPKIGARSRSENSSTAITTNTSANAPPKATDRGRTARPIASGVAAISTQPFRWWRKAERWKNHGFASWIRKAEPETNRASAVVSRQYGLFSFPRASPSSAAPGEHHHLRPGAVRERVDRRVGVEHHHRPHQHAHPEEEPREEVHAPRPHRPDLLADDRLGQEDQPEQEDPAGEEPVDHLSLRLHRDPPAGRCRRGARSRSPRR